MMKIKICKFKFGNPFYEGFPLIIAKEELYNG